MRVDEFIAHGARQIQSEENISGTPRLDSELLLCHVLDKSRTWLLTWPETKLDSAQMDKAMALLERRIAGEPIAYITGYKSFWNLTLKTGKTTLIPRPDTETLVEIALQKCTSEKSTVLDLGTGTGAIALALAKERTQWHVTGIDCQEECIALAKENAILNQVDNVDFYQSHWFSSIPKDTGTFQLIVSNPPYVEENDPHLRRADVRFEPHSALVSGKDGLNDIRQIAANAIDYLATGGWLIIEHGHLQGEKVREIFKTAELEQIDTLPDLSGNDRVTVGRKACEG